MATTFCHCFLLTGEMSGKRLTGGYGISNADYWKRTEGIDVQLKIGEEKVALESSSIHMTWSFLVIVDHCKSRESTLTQDAGSLRLSLTSQDAGNSIRGSYATDGW